MFKWSFFAAFFYANWFYGICAAVLMFETICRFQLPILPFKYWLFVVAATIFYYTIAYTFTKPNTIQLQQNVRLQWYSKHTLAIYGQLLICVMCCIPFFIAIWQHSIVLWQHKKYTLLALIFPIIGLLYYGSFLKLAKQFQIRSWGLVKPFIVGIVWAGIVTIYPIVFTIMQQHKVFISSIELLHYFVKKAMFISLLCILFDMKDYVSDYNERIQTFVVQYGVINTIKFIVIPLSVIGFIISVAMLYYLHYSYIAIAINSLAFVAFWWVLRIFNHKKTIAFYLVVIDGLMLVKKI
jgi:hypothetical protein